MLSSIAEQNGNKVYYEIYCEWRNYDWLASLFAIIGLILGVINYELEREYINFDILSKLN